MLNLFNFIKKNFGSFIATRQNINLGKVSKKGFKKV